MVVKFDLNQYVQNHQEQDEPLIPLLIEYMKNVIIKEGKLVVDWVNSFTYDNAIEKLQSSGQISLSNFHQLSFSDMDKLCSEIRRWRVYGNSDPTQLRRSYLYGNYLAN